MKRKCNEYYVFNDIVFVKFTNCEEYFLCDLEDWERLKQFSWSKHQLGYANTFIKGKRYMFHREVMNPADNMVVDHIYQISNGVCDNMKSNLRICTQKENTRNRRDKHVDNEKHIGVTWRKHACKWLAYIVVDGKFKYLGYYENFDDAVKARNNAETKYFNK